MKKYAKGEYGYLKYKKKISLIIMLASFLVILVVFITGIIITGDKNNIFTVMAAVLTLPAAKFAVAYFILVPHHSTPLDVYNETNNKFQGLYCCYDLIFSNKESPIGTQTVCISDTLIIAYTDEDKANKKLFESSVKEFLERDGLSVNVNLYTDLKSFTSKAKYISSSSGDSKTEPSQRILRNKESLLNMCL